MYTQISASLLQFAPFTEELVAMICERLKQIVVRKDEYLIKEGQTCRGFYFVEKGSFRHYKVEENGTESIINLYLENDWMFEYKSLMKQVPADAVIQATEDSEVFFLGINEFHELMKICDMFFRLGKIFELAIQSNDYQQNRLAPEEKYQLLLTRKPQLIQRFPLKMIASYLNITPETLSRIRKKISS